MHLCASSGLEVGGSTRRWAGRTPLGRPQSARVACSALHLWRTACSFVAMAVCLAAAGCGVEERRARRGSFIDEEAPARKPSAPPPKWRHTEAFASLTVVRDHQKSSHFIGGPDVEIRINDRASAYGRRGAELGEGALIVATHQLPEGVVRFAMDKRVGADPRDSTAIAWEYAVIDASSHVLEQGRIATCVRCHEEAPAGEVFGPPGL